MHLKTVSSRDLWLECAKSLNWYFKEVKKKEEFSVCLRARTYGVFSWLFLNGTSIVSKARKIHLFHRLFQHSLGYWVFNTQRILKLLKSTLHGPCNQAAVSHLHKTTTWCKVLPCNGGIKSFTNQGSEEVLIRPSYARICTHAQGEINVFSLLHTGIKC